MNCSTECPLYWANIGTERVKIILKTNITIRTDLQKQLWKFYQNVLLEEIEEIF